MKKAVLREYLKNREEKTNKVIELADKILTEDVEVFLEKVEKKIKEETKPKRKKKSDK